MLICVVFFFFKQKTAYEMRISDWSSDVCSSDLPPGAEVPLVAAVELGRRRRARAELRYLLGVGAVLAAPRPREVLPALQAVPRRQEAPAAGQLFAALHPAGARSGPRRGGAGAAPARRRAQREHPQPDPKRRRAGSRGSGT